VDENNRADRRFRTELPVFVSTVLDGQEAFIVDVSQQGLRLSNFDKAQPRMRVIIECQGDTVCGTVRWARPDGTVGVRLDTPLRDGPLAAIWSRFQNNVNSFGANKAPRAQSGFGKRSNDA
jgi:hypothetical protein